MLREGDPAWSPNLGAVIGAVFWPLALFVAVEIFARTNWGRELTWATLRWLGLLPVALVAAVVSYRHPPVAATRNAAPATPGHPLAWTSMSRRRCQRRVHDDLSPAPVRPSQHW